MKALICFGDSITAGWDGVSERPSLTDRLKSGLPGWVVRNAGVPGNNTNDALLRLQADVLNLAFDRVTVLFGANDASRHKGIPVEVFERNIARIVSAVSPEKTLLITPAPVNEAKQIKRTNQAIGTFAGRIRRIAAKTGCPLLDLNEAMQGETDYSRMLLEDGLHFTEAGYDFLARLIIEKIRQVEKTE